MSTQRSMGSGISRRRFLGAGVGAGIPLVAGRQPSTSFAASLLLPAGQAGPVVDELTIDLSSEPKSLDPALTENVDEWSVVHSVYDSLVQFGPDGSLEMLLAESFSTPDPTTVEIRIRAGVSFHNGEAFDSASVAFSLAHIVDPETASPVAGNFASIASVSTPDATTVVLTLSQPSPWLPTQFAPWLACLPPVHSATTGVGQPPVGTGPYRFVEWLPGERIVLEANPTYFGAAIKGSPIAHRVVFRFVSEPSTRVTDLLAGTADIVRGVPYDQIETVEENGAAVRVTPLSGTTFVRIPTDVAPFSDVRVRQALNYAVDVPAIVDALLGGNGTPLASPFVPGGLGYDPDLAPYGYDPERAKALLREVGFDNRFQTTLAFSSLERSDVVEAIAGQLSEAGIDTEVERVEATTFNRQWTDPEAAPLRFVSWRPMYDPFTLLSLVFSSSGFLSRHDNPNAQALIDSGAVEADPSARAEIYRRLGKVLHDEPGAIYLWSLTSFYGVAEGTPDWTTRADDYLVPALRTP